MGYIKSLLAIFADDTTLSLDGSEKSLYTTMSTLKSFAEFSGLKVNPEKNQVDMDRVKKDQDISYVRTGILTGHKLSLGY